MGEKGVFGVGGISIGLLVSCHSDAECSVKPIFHQAVTLLCIGN